MQKIINEIRKDTIHITDKNELHSYIDEFYSKEFIKYKNDKIVLFFKILIKFNIYYLICLFFALSIIQIVYCSNCLLFNLFFFQIVYKIIFFT
jgi:hypothetical protein